jgi:hypothetical protein
MEIKAMNINQTEIRRFHAGFGTGAVSTDTAGGNPAASMAAPMHIGHRQKGMIVGLLVNGGTTGTVDARPFWNLNLISAHANGAVSR